MGNHFLCRTLSSHSPSGSSLSTYLVISRVMGRMRYTALFSIMIMMMISILWQWLPMMCENALTSQRPSSGVLFQCSQTPRENDQAGLITKLQCKQGPKSGRNITLHPLPPFFSFSCPVCWVWHRTKSKDLPSLPFLPRSLFFAFFLSSHYQWRLPPPLPLWWHSRRGCPPL